MDEDKGTKEGDADVKPPYCPDDVKERFPAKPVLLINEASGDGDEGGAAHGICPDVETLSGMFHHRPPYVGEYDVTGDGERIEENEESEVEEEENPGQHLHYFPVIRVREVV